MRDDPVLATLLGALILLCALILGMVIHNAAPVSPPVAFLAGVVSLPVIIGVCYAAGRIATELHHQITDV